MARITIPVRLNVDLDEFRAEYGDEALSQQDIRDHIAGDLLEALRAGPYAEALKTVDTI